MQLSVYSEDRSKVGVHTIEIKGSPADNPESSAAYTVELEIIDPCLSTILKISNPGKLTYTVGEGKMKIAFDVKVTGQSICKDYLIVELYLQPPNDIILSSLRYGLREIQFSIDTYEG